MRRSPWRPRTLFGRFLTVFSLILLANLILAAVLIFSQSQAAVTATLRYQLGEAAGRLTDDYQRRQLSNLTNAQWANSTNLGAASLAGIEVAAYEPQNGAAGYDAKQGWSDPKAAETIGERAGQVLAGRRLFWLDQGKAYLAVPVRTANNWAILLLSLPQPSASTGLANYGRPILFTLLAVSLPTLVLAFLLVRRLARPIAQMAQMADAVAAGDFSRRAPPAGDQEIDMLGASLNQMAVQLGQAEQDRLLLVRGISHDLRTPLTTIKANTQAMLDGIIPADESREILADTIGEIDRLRGLADNLLLAAGQGAHWPLRLEPQDLADIVRRTVSQMQFLAGQSGQTIRTALPDRLVVTIDGQQIRQALVNLLDNAIRYGRPGGDIQVSLAAARDGTSLAVQDEGPGIPPEVQSRLFQPLVKGYASAGSGLGLYLCRRIAEAHGGSIAANSSSSGTCVTLLLPGRNQPETTADQNQA
jgi:two-component system, OmpR family, sensor histidine kinase BaeS